MSDFSCFQYSRVIWLGDLNYRIALSYRSAKALVEMQNWRALLENDQVHLHIKFPNTKITTSFVSVHTTIIVINS